MTTSNSLFTEILQQGYSDIVGVNIVKIAFLFFLKYHRYSINVDYRDFAIYLYRFIIDQPALPHSGSCPQIRSISYARPLDLIPTVKLMAKNWNKPSHPAIIFTDYGIKTTVGPLANSEVDILNKIVDSICLKYLDSKLSYTPDLDKDLYQLHSELNDLDAIQYINEINSTRFRNRAFEKLDYCPCCDECNRDELFAVHIDRSKDFYNPENSILLCAEHAKLYVEECFSFKKNGIIQINNHCEMLNKQMRLSRAFITSNNVDFLS